MKKTAGSLTVGILGAGLMGRWHARNVQFAGGRITAITDSNMDAAEELAGSFQDVAIFPDLDSMLAQVSLQVLHICTPTNTHVACIESAVANDVNILVEKPMTGTYAEAQHLYEIAAGQGVLLCPVHQFVFQDGVLNAQKALPHIGSIVHLKSTIRSAGGVSRSDAEKDQIAADILPHCLSLIQLFTEAGLSSSRWQAIRPQPGDIFVQGEHAGIPSTIEISLSGRPTTNSMEIVGSAGTIHIDLFHGYSFVQPGAVSRTRKMLNPFDLASRHLAAATTNMGRRAFRRETAYPGLRRLITSFYSAVRTKSAPPIAPDAVLDVACAREKILEALDNQDTGLPEPLLVP